jgi:hypothetical protein
LQVIDLEINCSRPTNFLAMKNLEEFLKTQKKIDVLSFSRENNYDGILTHILNLESLRTLVVERAKRNDSLPRFIRNDNVQKIVIKTYSDLINFAQFVRSFPNTKSLHLRDISREDIPLINSFKFLEELIIRDTRQIFQRIEGLQLPNLKKIEINSFEDYSPENFKPIFSQFIENHPNIEELKLSIFGSGSMIDLEDLKVVLGNLKNLKKLSIYIEFDFQIAIVELCELIKKYAENLNNLELQFEEVQNCSTYVGKTVKTIVENYFRSVLPKLKVDFVVWKPKNSFCIY